MSKACDDTSNASSSSSSNERKETPLNLDEEIENLPHEELCEITESSLRRLIAADPLLKDLPGDVTTEEVLSQIAVIQGQSITVTVLRYSEKPLSVVIPQQSTTVRDLKRAVQRAFSLLQQRSRSRSKVSWRHVWRSYQLQHEGRLLDDDRRLVAHYGVRNRSQLHFVKRLQVRNRMPPTTAATTAIYERQHH